MRNLTSDEERILRLTLSDSTYEIFTEDEIAVLKSLETAKRIRLIIRVDNEHVTEGSLDITELGKLALRFLPALRGYSNV